MRRLRSLGRNGGRSRKRLRLRKEFLISLRICSKIRPIFHSFSSSTAFRFPVLPNVELVGCLIPLKIYKKCWEVEEAFKRVVTTALEFFRIYKIN